jgi:hypothetical protein
MIPDLILKCQVCGGEALKLYSGCCAVCYEMTDKGRIEMLEHRVAALARRIEVLEDQNLRNTSGG